MTSTPDKNKNPLIRLTFVGKDSDAPILTHLIQEYDVTVNILQANIETIQNKTIGFTVCELSGVNTTSALAYLDELSIQAEVVGYA